MANLITSAPWELRDQDEKIFIVGKDGEEIAEVLGTGIGHPGLARLANARLIAASPELYDAADELLGALADIYSHLQKTSPERLVLPVREAGNKLAYAMRKVEAGRG